MALLLISVVVCLVLLTLKCNVFRFLEDSSSSLDRFLSPWLDLGYFHLLILRL